MDAPPEKEKDWCNLKERAGQGSVVARRREGKSQFGSFGKKTHDKGLWKRPCHRPSSSGKGSGGARVQKRSPREKESSPNRREKSSWKLLEGEMQKSWGFSGPGGERSLNASYTKTQKKTLRGMEHPSST